MKYIKRALFIVDCLLIIITAILLVHYNNSDKYGLAALEDTGRFVVCLIALGIETLILLSALAIWLFRKFTK